MSKSSEPKVSPHQRFEVCRIARSELKNAPYNPRKLDKHSAAKLKKNLQTVGLLEPLVWNKTTGHLVSGHQRLAQLDSLQRSENYLLDVAVVELDEKTEKEQNVFMNNPSTQGTWDMDALQNLLQEVEIPNTGFDDLDLSILNDDSEIFLPSAEITAALEPLAKTAEEIEAIRKQSREAKRKCRSDNSTEHYVIFVFPSEETKLACLRRFSLNETMRYFDGARLEALATP